MTPSAPFPTPESPALSCRLQAYARYLAVVAEQLETETGGDARRAHGLAVQRDRMQQELAGMEPALLLQEGLSELDQRAEVHELMRERWLELQSGALRSARSIRFRPASRRRYQDIPSAAARVDVRF